MTESSAIRSHQRVSPEEREAAAERIRVAAGEGRLSLEELEARLEAALSARTYGELDALVDDLPVRADLAASGAGAGAVPESVRLAVSHGHLERVGGWVVPRRLVVELAFASAYLDFRSAVIPASGLEIWFQAVRSKIVLAVPGEVGVAVQELGRHRGKVVQRGGRGGVVGAGAGIRLTGDLQRSKLTVKRAG
ncbi:MAG: DUF1707 domain-containing protein [Catenulispora sp.]|nr:DUF1707 domain-containing protein [Catenulispora sp.]